MSLDNIQLPAIVIQGLFKRSLVELKIEEKESKKVAQPDHTVLGNNNRHILIMVESRDAVYLPDDQLNFLLGILAACNLTMEDVAILNIANNKGVNYKTVTDQLLPEKLFLFGINPVMIELPLDFPNYQVQQYNNQLYLTAPGFADLQRSKSDKTKLWNCLKQIFNV